MDKEVPTKFWKSSSADLDRGQIRLDGALSALQILLLI